MRVWYAPSLSRSEPRAKKARGVVEGDEAALGDHAVDELERRHVEGERLVARVEQGFLVVGKVGDEPVEHVVVGDSRQGDAPAGRSVIFRERVTRHGVEGEVGDERAVAGNEGAVDVVGEYHQVWIGLYDLAEGVDGGVVDGIAGRIRRIGDEQHLVFGILELEDVVGVVLPGVEAVGVHTVGADRQHVVVEFIEVGNLQIGREDRHHDGD